MLNDFIVAALTTKNLLMLFLFKKLNITLQILSESELQVNAEKYFFVYATGNLKMILGRSKRKFETIRILSHSKTRKQVRLF